MFTLIVRLFFIALGAVVGYEYSPLLFERLLNSHSLLLSSSLFDGVLMGAVFYLVTIPLVKYVVRLLKHVEFKMEKLPLSDLVAGTVGIVIGLILGELLGAALSAIPVVGHAVEFFTSVLLGYLGFRVALAKRTDLSKLMSGRNSRRTKDNGRAPRNQNAKILDTSVIIDGRILDVIRTGILDGRIVIPAFVLQELQYIADSSDTLKRVRGRRGLDTLMQIQENTKVPVEISNIDFEDVDEVDSKLVCLAKKLNGKVVTNDFNLNKVCEIQHVDVLNINDLSNAIKTVYLPGEILEVDVVKPGKTDGQGIAYLNDGTMIVVEDGKQSIGERIRVFVTSMMNTSAGRIIFTKPS